MKRIPFFLSLLIGFIIILVSIYGFFLLSKRPGLPPGIKVENIYKIDDIEIEHPQDLEFILSQKSIGELSTFSLRVNGKIEKREAEFVPYYSQAPFPLIYLFIGLFCLANGTLVFFLRREDARAVTFYWASLAFSSALIISGEFYCLRKDWLSYFPGILHLILYPLAPALLFHFSLLFSKYRVKISKLAIYFPAFIFIGVLQVLFLYSSLKSSLETYRIRQSVYFVFRGYVVLFVFLSIIQLILSYRKTFFEEERAQIKWIFYGLFTGLGPFILLYQLPQAVGLKYLIGDEFSNVFFIFIPLSFAFSIVKFKLMDVEVVINRSIVYSVLTVFVVSIYLLSVSLLQNVFSKFFVARQSTVSLIAALAAAVAFHPGRKKIQEFVDKAFFRISYDYRKSILSFNERAHKLASSDHLINFFLLKIKNTLPLEYIGVFIYSLDSGKQELLVAKDGEKELGNLPPIFFDPDKIFARKKAVRTEENMDFSQESSLEEKKLELLIPFSFRAANLAGFLSLGKKKSGERFTRDDIELLSTMAGELALNLERIRLQEEVIYERAEKNKLDELSRLKTEFISSVSHEIRTPMSSIQGLAEVLQAGKIRDKTKQDELISLMASESSRLSRFLHNILDFAKIEKQTKTYDFQKVEIQTAVKEAIKLFQFRLESEGFVLRENLPEIPLYLEVDLDALRQALTNLIDNAIKYSSDKKEIAVQIIEKEDEVEIQVRDEGIGIPAEEKEKIFHGFYRHAEASKHNPRGVGLGLKIIKHIMEAHRGRIQVDSQPNKGSTFSLIFPKP
jgi:signal transduction histidine kinase